MQIVAHARYVFRTVQRLIDNCAKNHDVEPLEHQAMIQIFGASEQRLPIGRLAERLDIDSALASRLVQQLESRHLVRRTRSEEDKRAIYVSLTREGVKQIRSVVEDVHTEVEFFRLVSDESQRRATHEIAAFYVGSPGAEGVASSRKPADRVSSAPIDRARPRKAAASRSMV
jgi:DNA-binding MarR family transcriptional regulator